MTAFEKLHVLAKENAILHSTAATLGWDQETYLPPGAHAHRAAQISYLSTKAHELVTSPAWKRALDDALAENNGNDVRRTLTLEEMQRQLKRAEALPVALVARSSEASSHAKHAWAAARKASDFSAFAPHLETLLGIAREKADCYGYASEPHDALLENYERGTSAAEIATLFNGMEGEVSAIARAAIESTQSRQVALPAGPYPIEKQQALNRRIAEAIGFDFDAGRIDTTAHPFCTTLGPRDVRLTTRYDENDFTSSLSGVLHEAGHGMYEQGLNADEYGLPGADAASLGIHESQSRLWENQIGRSRAFWEIWLPVAAEYFPQLRPLELDDFLAYLNRAELNFIRVDSDETSYDLHIMLRFDLERRMLRGDLAVRDVPAAWNEAFERSFGLTPPDDARGCLQDIHWAMGGLGYFPTYTLGNINAAQLYATARKDAAIASGIDGGNYAPLLGWLRQNVHQHGATLSPAELMAKATGRKPETADYLAHLRTRIA